MRTLFYVIFWIVLNFILGKGFDLTADTKIFWIAQLLMTVIYFTLIYRRKKEE